MTSSMPMVVPSGIKELVHFSVLEDDEVIVLQFNYAENQLVRFADGARMAALDFRYIAKVTTDANTSVEMVSSAPDEAYPLLSSLLHCGLCSVACRGHCIASCRGGAVFGTPVVVVLCLGPALYP